jgi:ABC-type polysaccharide/polyol phosphate transport system ATPase subunit
MTERRSFGQLAGLEIDPSRPAITVQGVSERFRLYHERPVGLKERLYRMRRASYTEFNALERVSFTVGHGESVAVIGHNGSGKSTLLKLLARILPPDEGRVATNGRVASLLELGAGFHGDLTGRENIFLNGAILGLTRSQIDERFDEIVDFAGIRPLLDTAVRTYSSGLYVRLGFAIAVTVDPDILLVDEVLAVGDAEFQAKSLARMRRFKQDGKTVVLVSHDLDAVVEMCQRAILLERGRVVFDGPVDEAVDRYRQRIARVAGIRVTSGDRTIPVAVEGAQLVSMDGQAIAEATASSSIALQVRFAAVEPLEACNVSMSVTDGSDAPIYEFHTRHQGVGVGPLEPGESAMVELRFAAPRRAGQYTVSATVTDAGESPAWGAVPISSSLQIAPSVAGTERVDLAASAAVLDGPARSIGDVADILNSGEPGSQQGRRQA